MSTEKQGQYDVIVIGGGHAGTEAALAAARVGARTLLLTHNIDTVGQMSCNPAIGGIGKGHLVKEIDALGGAMAQAIDESGIQFRTLNARKGPAVRATRAQADRVLYKQAIRRRVERQANLTLFQQPVDDLIIQQDRIVGVITQMGLTFYAPAVVLTTGTFLGGKIHVGHQQSSGGRAGDPPSIALAEKLRALPFSVGRLKTGTPPRIDGKTVDFSVMETQPGDMPAPVFSYLSDGSEKPKQVPCHITYTNEATHQIITDNIELSAMYSGNIEGVGPRYCPSIEDKVVRFADKSRHQVFVEPEGLDTFELYPNGISTSLPFDVQVRFVRSMKGFEQAHITRPGYAIEYDYFDPRGLERTLQTKCIAGLFFAGQINGTTGYEEAGAQGLLAGLNAARYSQEKALWYPRRDEAYLGVLVDDLVTLGTQEPYRMFTSRAEYRLLLREDNADFRLTKKGHELGVVDDARFQAFEQKYQRIEIESERLRKLWLRPDTPQGSAIEALIQQPLQKETSAYELLRRPQLDYQQLMTIEALQPETIDVQVGLQIDVEAKYSGYIARQSDEIERLKRNEGTIIPDNFDYDAVSGLSNEVKQKLQQIKPTTLGQAMRISGVTPAAISLLLVTLKRSGKSHSA